MLSVRTDRPEETMALGRGLAGHLTPGTVIALTGELGAGKTVFAQGVAQGLEIENHVTSPTFTIINEYRGRLPFYHMDAYRLEDVSEVTELGLDEYFSSPGITVIEWPERIEAALPPSYLRIEIEKRWEESGAEYRVIKFSVVGDELGGVIGELEKSENFSA